ncbi:hypothetical protein ACFYW6_23870 [Streptomyces sp. NPDC002659]|uniref:golvesin C-terminal-like domain-containing protein n=1 Tax=Streptomyces sp. NPDC002659 TaxID=3364656 RepID=UPI00369D871A
MLSLNVNEATWKDDCVTTCGWEVVRFNETYPEEADGTAYPPTCSVSGLPAGALIVDDVPAGTPVVRPGCTNSWTNSGSFSFSSSNNGSEAVYPSKVDLHQLGAGFGGHFYFGHTRQDDAKGQRLKITGTWQLNQKVNGTAMVYVHLPDHGAQTKYATYQIETARWTAQRTIAQPGSGNRWVPLGAFRFSDVPRVRLTTTASDGTGDEDLAFDAIAVAPGDYKVNSSEISLPPANPNSPDIDHSDQPHEPTKETLAGVSARAGGTGVGACQVLNKKAGTSLCLSSQTAFRKPTREQLSKVRPLAKRAGELHLVKWCSEVSGNHYSRLEACLHRTVTGTVFRNEKPIGQAELFVRTEIGVKDGGKLVREVSTIFPTRIDKEIGSIALTWDPDCVGACKSDPPLVTGQMAWGTDGTGWPIAQAQVTHEWTGATLDKINLQWFMKVTSPSADNEPTALWGIPEFELRCDAQVGNSPGCVFWKVVPTYTVDTPKYPTASAMYWLAQTRLKSHPGSRTNPLHRLEDRNAQEGNRRRMCRNASAKFDPHPDTPPEVQSRTLIAAALVIATGATASACTSDSSPAGTSKDVARASARPSPDPSPPGSASSPAPSSTPRAPSTDSAPVQQDTGQETPSEPTTGSSQADAPAAAKNDVTVRQLIPKPDGHALWVPVSIHNRGRESASYTAVIRITGPNGFASTVKVTTGPLPPGRTASQSQTAQSPSGTAVPSNPKAEIVDVVRTPA